MKRVDQCDRDWYRVAVIAAAVLLMMGCAAVSRGQEPEGRARAVEGGPSKSAEVRQAPIDLAPLLQVLRSLTDQVQQLTDEVRRLRKAGERNDAHTELLLDEERLARIEDRIAATNQRQTELANQEQAIRYRQSNIDNELLVRAPLNRDEVKTAIQSEIDRGLDAVHSEQAANQQRLADLQSDANRLRSHIESVRRRLDSVQDKTPSQN